MSQTRSQKFQNPPRNWRNDPDIISMETRILPKNTPPTTAPSAQRAMRLFPQVQIPVRSGTQSSATPECTASMSSTSQKRPQSSDSLMDPTPCKRQRVAIIKHSPKPKREPDAISDGTPPTTNTTTTAENNAAINSTGNDIVGASAKERAHSSYAHNLGREMIFFRFGDQILPSSIHRKVLHDAIPGFDTELKLLRLGQNELAFPEDMQGTIELLIEWCYKSALPKLSEESTPQDCFERIKLYCLASRYECVELMNDTIHFLVRYLRKNFPRWDVSWTTYAYRNTHPGSPLRKLLSKWFTNKFFSTDDKGRWTTDVFSAAASGHPDLLHDVMVHIRSLQGVQFPNPKKDTSAMYQVKSVELIETAEPQPVTAVTVEGPTEERVFTPEESDSEMYEVEEDADPDFDEAQEEESEDDDSPLTRRGGRSLRSGNRSFMAPS